MSERYSVLLMRDDLQVRRFRFHPAWFRAIIYIFLFLVFVSGAGIYFSWTLWSENRELDREAQHLKRMVQQKDVQLSSLENMKNILELHDPEELQTLIASAAAPIASTELQPAVDLKDVFKVVEGKGARLEKVALEQLENGGMRLAFTLQNEKEKEGALTGYIEVSLVSRDGHLLELPLPMDEVSFHIQSFRTFSSVFSLPRGLLVNDVYALRLEVVAEDGEAIFSKAYTLPSILSS